MKNLRIAMTAMGLAAALFAAPSLHADDAKADKAAPKEDGGAKGHEGWGEKRGDMMKKELGLSDDQVTKMKAANKAQQEAMKPLMDKMKLDVDSLRVMVDKKAADDQLKAAVDGLKADHQAMQDQEMKGMEAKAAILTPLQQAKAAIAMIDRMKGGMEGMGGMHGGMMGGHEGMDHGAEGKKDGDAHGPATKSGDGY